MSCRELRCFIGAVCNDASDFCPSSRPLVRSHRSSPCIVTFTFRCNTGLRINGNSQRSVGVVLQKAYYITVERSNELQN